MSENELSFTYIKFAPRKVKIPYRDACGNKDRPDRVNQREVSATLLSEVRCHPQADYLHQEARPNDGYVFIPHQPHRELRISWWCCRLSHAEGFPPWIFAKCQRKEWPLSTDNPFPPVQYPLNNDHKSRGYSFYAPRVLAGVKQGYCRALIGSELFMIQRW